MKKHMNLFFPQWQGGGQDLSTYEGALELKHNYCQGIQLAEVPVGTDAVSAARHNIVGYDEIFQQLVQAKALIRQTRPATIFTVGGGCDADVAPIAYLNDRLKGDLTVLWFDAHGDMNTPASSASRYFYGMPLRALLGEGEAAIVKLTQPHLLPAQLVLLGARALDAAEEEYITDQNIRMFGVQDIEQKADSVIEAVKMKGSANIYIHIDLDVLDFVDFPHVPVPAPAGLKSNTLKKLLQKLDQEFKLVGLGLFEYQNSGIERIDLLADIIKIGAGL